MSNQEQLRDKLLNLQGLKSSGPSESQVTIFRQQLVEEERRAKRLGWLAQIPVWLWFLLMLGLCMSERLWERLSIPFAAASLLVMVLIVGGGFPIVITLGRRLKHSRQTIQRLKKLMPEYMAPTVQVGTFVVNYQSQRYIHWLKLVWFAIVIWVLFAVGGIVVFSALIRKFTIAPLGYQSMMACLCFCMMVVAGLRTSLSELTVAKQINRFFWWPAPDLSAIQLPKRLLTGLGGGFVLTCVVLAVFLIYQENTVYAKVMRELKTAWSFHVQGFGYEGGEPVLRSEIWYHHRLGTRIQVRVGDTVMDRYHNRRNQWQHTQGKDYVVHLPGQGSILPRELTETARYLKRCKRDPEGDKLIDDDLCALYLVTHEKSRSMFWIDEQQRFRRYEEEELVEGVWQAVELVTITYDVSLDADQVTPPSGPNIRIIKPGAMLKDRYRLDTALATEEVVGLIVAVHEVQRCQGNIVLHCSIRATDASLLAIDAAGLDRHEHSSQEYGRFQTTSWWRRLPNGDLEERHYARKDLGQVVKDNVYYYWCVMRPSEQWPGFENKLEICGRFFARGSLAELRKQEGQAYYQDKRPLMTIDLPLQESSFEALCDDLHRIQPEVTGLYLNAKSYRRQEIAKPQIREELEVIFAGLRPYRELWEKGVTTIECQVVDEQGQPVVGAQIGGKQHAWVWKPLAQTDQAGRFDLHGPDFLSENTAQDMGGGISLVHVERGLAAFFEFSGSDFGQVHTITMKPACRVRAKYVCDDLVAEGKTLGAVESSIHLSDTPGKRQTPTLLTRIPSTVMREVYNQSDESHAFNTWLLPGRYDIYVRAYKQKAECQQSFNVPQNRRELDLGTLELKVD